MRTELLKVLLQDHLGGAAAGVALADRIRSNHPGTAVAASLARIVPEIERDKATLERLIESLGIKPSTTKQAMGWASEQFMAGVLAVARGQDPALGLVLELETLLMGIHGKRLMWEGLEALKPSPPELARFDFAHLHRRATEQHDELAAHHAAACREAFGGSS